MQGQRARAMRGAMIRSLIVAALLCAGTSAALAKGTIETVTRGPYVCELPDDANVTRGLPQAEHNFTIQTGSHYTSPKGSGTYLRRGEVLEMTSGPHRGEKYQVLHPGFLKLLSPDGEPGRLRCVVQPGG